MKTHKQAYSGSDLALCGVSDRPGGAKKTGIVFSNGDNITCKTCLSLMAKQCKTSDTSCVYHACMSDDCRYDVMKLQGFDVTIIKRNCDR